MNLAILQLIIQLQMKVIALQQTLQKQIIAEQNLDTRIFFGYFTDGDNNIWHKGRKVGVCIPTGEFVVYGGGGGFNYPEPTDIKEKIIGCLPPMKGITTQ